uniref:Uncharacterized protein n=1 Tax=Timema cristinae TaxID=61476 RepID=A0A7R9DG95_TIMCR|nr:unnamed protein product [Timema cristinae]
MLMVLGTRKVIFIGNVHTFAWRESGKPFWKKTTGIPSDQGSNLDLHVIGSLVYCESNASDHMATENFAKRDNPFFNFCEPHGMTNWSCWPTLIKEL